MINNDIKNFVYYDITHLVSWKGNLTGIPRTTDEIARRLKKEKNVIYVIWIPEQKLFKAVDINEYYLTTEVGNRNYYKNKTITASTYEADFLTHVKRSILKTEFSRKAARKIKRVSLRLFQDAKTRINFKNNIKPKKGDIFFIPCGVWDDQNYIEKIVGYRKSGIMTLFLCYDLLPIVVPQFSGQWGEPMRIFLSKVGIYSERILAISNFTKSDLLSWAQSNNLNAPPIDVIRLGDIYELANEKKPDNKILKKNGILDGLSEFVLCTGTIEARKNHTLLYYTYKFAKSKNIKMPKLVIAGRRGHRTEDIIDIMKDDPDINKDIIILFDVSDQELSWLYKNCQFTVYPSFYEGWGLPIAESIANEVPCICSNTTSMTEVAPSFVEFFNPASPEDCLRAFIKYSDKNNLSKAKSHAKKYKKVSWDYTYEQIKESLKKINPKVLN